MPQDLSGDWRSLIGNDTGGGVRRGSWNSDADDLARAEIMGRGDTGACSADVKGLGELNELDAGRVDTAEKDGHLEADARGLTALNGAQSRVFVVDFDFQAPPGSTPELIQLCIFDARKYILASACKWYRHSRLGSE
jgi:hypothetical protein